MDLAEGFGPALRDFDVGALWIDSNVIYGLWPDWRLGFLNEAWHRFARENEGEPAISREWGLGRCVLDAVQSPLRQFYADAFSRCLEFERPWSHNYECSSPGVRRLYALAALPLREKKGLLLVNVLRVEEPHAETHAASADYFNEWGIVKQCMHCRRVQKVQCGCSWDIVPEWVKRPPEQTSHGLCPVCLQQYYPEI